MNPSHSRSLPLHHRLWRKGLTLGAVALLAGCAHVANPSPEDPWESYNRSMYAFNTTVDRAFMRPVARGYEAVTPRPVRTCINNIFGNFGDIWSGINSLLQGRGRDFIDTLGRVLFNTTMGVGGCIDVASMNGARKIPNDFGITLGVWGFGSGPYLELPFFGPSSVRDGVGTAATFASPIAGPASAVLQIDNVPVRNSIIALYIIDTRASLLDADRLVDQTALDRYSFIRDAYLQRRKAMLDSRKRSEHAGTDQDLPGLSDGQSSDLPVYEDPDDDLPDYDDPDGNLPVYDDPDDPKAAH